MNFCFMKQELILRAFVFLILIITINRKKRFNSNFLTKNCKLNINTLIYDALQGNNRYKKKDHIFFYLDH